MSVFAKIIIITTLFAVNIFALRLLQLYISASEFLLPVCKLTTWLLSKLFLSDVWRFLQNFFFINFFTALSHFCMSGFLFKIFCHGIFANGAFFVDFYFQNFFLPSDFSLYDFCAEIFMSLIFFIDIFPEVSLFIVIFCAVVLLLSGRSTRHLYTTLLGCGTCGCAVWPFLPQFLCISMEEKPPEEVLPTPSSITL